MTNLTKENLIKKYDVPAGYRYLVVARKNDDLLYLTNDLQDILDWYWKYFDVISEKAAKDYLVIDIEKGRRFSIKNMH
jgi:hypothetical protein